jgi:hypothetical protein
MLRAALGPDARALFLKDFSGIWLEFINAFRTVWVLLGWLSAGRFSTLRAKHFVAEYLIINSVNDQIRLHTDLGLKWYR